MGGQRDDFCTVTSSDPNPSRQLERLEAELHVAVAGLEAILADPGAEGLARPGADGELIVSPLRAEQVPADVDTLAEATSARLPRVQLPALLIEVDQLTGFSEEFTHAGGARTPLLGSAGRQPNSRTLPPGSDSSTSLKARLRATVVFCAPASQNNTHERRYQSNLRATELHCQPRNAL